MMTSSQIVNKALQHFYDEDFDLPIFEKKTKTRPKNDIPLHKVGQRHKPTFKRFLMENEND